MNREVRLILIICFCHGLTHALMLLLPTVYVGMEGDLALSVSEFGFLFAGISFLFGAGAFPVGWLSDRIGARNALIIGMGAAGLATLLSGLAPTKLLFITAILLMGAGLSFYHPTGLSWVSRAIPSRGKALGYHGVAGNLGLAGGPMLGGAVSYAADSWTPLEGWRVAFVLFGLATLWVTYEVFRAPVPEEAEATEEAHSVAADLPVSPGEFFRQMKLPLALILVNGIVYGLVYRGLTSFVAKVVEQQVSFATGNLMLVGLITGAGFVAGMFGQLLGGYLNHHAADLERLYFVIYAVGAGGFTLLTLVDDWSFVGVLLLLNLVLFLWQPITNNLIAIHTPSHLYGLSFGMYFTSQFAIGAVAPSILGVVAEYGSVSAAFVTVSLIAVVGFAVSLMTYRHRHATSSVWEWWHPEPVATAG